MDEQLKVKTMQEFMAEGKQPEILFWVGSAGSYDDRAKKISRAFVKLLNRANVNFAVLGQEESSTGDVAKRAGNEFLFQMQAMMNIELLNGYEIKRIVTCDPHSFNTLKNEYPGLGGTYEVVHHTQYLKELLDQGRLTLQGETYKGKRITFHDPCYLGRANSVYDAPREVLAKTNAELVEMKRHKKTALCCGAGGAQMFKEPEKGDMDINVLRTKDALETNPNIIATGCPYCNTMMTDGIKAHEKEDSVTVLDVAELLANSI
ncbi:Cysteine-rich domain-containing protein [Flagellimonas taeanensis]|uniref:Cysteine-rich domain-containing protein n=1 Tax=Flagellimonas taeanensis TaxID=1005926 RepID=A0A1M6UZP0_9FLAO|nr:(Fe-S)-binding protein [Allomuricauda taeanensis]SFC21873.1 Cysteine-rich domain-containing protein [Allomuricauda taeanensis]SHK74658.1 Cysteine-rich domain-containing protein [Allomuricauda taeanensis]